MSCHSEHSNKSEPNGGPSASATAAFNRDLEKGTVDPIEQESITSPNLPADGHPDSSSPSASRGRNAEEEKSARLKPPKAVPHDTRPISQDQQAIVNSTRGMEFMTPDSGEKAAEKTVEKVVEKVVEILEKAVEKASKKELQSDIPANLDQYTTFWKAYNDDADAQDKEIVDILGGDLDVLLVFAGLFSASNVAFIIEAYKDLKQDNTDTTNDLLRTLIHNQLSPSNPIIPEISQFTATPRAVRVNALFFTSLSCSLLTALGAVLGKQWLNHYKREGRRMSLAERGRERQRKFMGLELWQLEQVVETLPTLLQLSLFLFLGALIDFLWAINRTIAGVIAGFSIVTFCFYAITTTIAVFYPSSPFQTRFSSLLRTIGRLCRRFLAWFRGLTLLEVWASLKNYSSVFVTTLRRRWRQLPLHGWSFHRPIQWFHGPLPRYLYPDHVDTSIDDELSLECISWLLGTSSVDNTISLAATAALMLPESVWEKTNQVPNALRLILRARIFESKVILDVRPGAVKTTLDLLHSLVMKWDRTSQLVVPNLPDNTLFITAFENMLWRVVRAYPVEGRAAIQILEMLLTLRFTVEPRKQEIDLLCQGAFQIFMRDRVMSSELGPVVFLENPMKVVSIIELLGLPVALGVTTALQPLLRSVLLIDESKSIRFCHHSVRSFFTDPTRYQSPDFKTTFTLCHTKLALGCINHMKKHLRRNILGVDNPLLLNEDILDLEVKLVEAGVSEALQYACRYWAAHLQFSALGHPELLGAMQDFCAITLLPWLEVMSLLGYYDETASTIGRAEAWMRSGDSSDVTMTLLQDMHRFIVLFKASVKPSAAAIYSLAVPLTYPSELHTHYHEETAMSIYPKSPCNFWTSTSKVISLPVGGATSFAVSHDNGCTVSGPYGNTVDIFTMRDGQCVAKLEGHERYISSIVFAPYSNSIVSGSNDSTIKIWDARTHSLKFTLVGHCGDVNTVNVSPDSKYIVSGSDDRTVRLWDANTGSHIATMEGHSGWIRAVMFSPDGHRILSASSDTTVRIWNTVDRTLLGVLDHSSRVRSAVFSSDGTLIASLDDNKMLKIWDAESHSLIRTLEDHSSIITSLAFSTDCRSIASGSVDGIIRVWDVLDGSVRTILEGHSAHINVISFTPDQRYIVSGGRDNTVRTWNWNGPNNSVINTPAGHTSRITEIAFCSNGRILASGDDNGEVHIWNVDGTTRVVRLHGLSGSVKSITFSSDGKYITASSSGLTTSWDLDTHQITSDLGSSGKYHHSSAEHSIEHVPGEVACQSAVEYQLALQSSMLYANKFSAGQEMRSKELLTLPVPNISASGAHGYHLAVGTEGGQIVILDFSSIISFETITY